MALTIFAGHKIYPHTYAMDEAQTTQGIVYYPIGLYWESGIASNEVWWDTTRQSHYPRVDPWTNATFFNNLKVGERDLTSYEINLLDSKRYIRAAVDSLQYSGVELRLCYDWYDDDPDIGGSGTQTLAIWTSSYHPTTRIDMNTWKSSNWNDRTRVYLSLVTNWNVVNANGAYCIETPYFY